MPMSGDPAGRRVLQRRYFSLSRCALVAALFLGIQCDGQTIAEQGVQVNGSQRDAGGDDAAPTYDATLTEGGHSDGLPEGGRDDGGTAEFDATTPSQNGAEGGVAAEGGLGDAGTIGPPEIRFGEMTCPPGAVVKVGGQELCVDLRNESMFPGPCSVETRVAAVSGGDPWFTYEFCDFDYPGEQLDHVDCDHQERSAVDTLEGKCEVTSDEAFNANCRRDTLSPWGDRVSFTYDDQDKVVSATRWAYGDMWSTRSTLTPANSSLTECDTWEEEVCTTETITTEEQQDWIAGARKSFPMPVFDMFRTVNNDPCTTVGSVAEGFVTQQCGDLVYEYGYHEGGQLMSYRVGQIIQVDAGLPRTQFGELFLYDRGGNLRYVVRQEEDNYNTGGLMTVLDEYSHSCWLPLECHSSEESLLQNGSFEMLDSEGFADGWAAGSDDVTAVIEVDDAVAACNAASIKMVMTGSWEYWVTQTIADSAAVVGDRVRITGYYRMDVSDYGNWNGGVGVSLSYSGSELTSTLTDPVDVDTWVPFEREFTVMELPIHLRLLGSGPENGGPTTVWFDDIRMQLL